MVAAQRGPGSSNPDVPAVDESEPEASDAISSPSRPNTGIDSAGYEFDDEEDEYDDDENEYEDDEDGSDNEEEDDEDEGSDLAPGQLKDIKVN